MTDVLKPFLRLAALFAVVLVSGCNTKPAGTAACSSPGTECIRSKLPGRGLGYYQLILA